MFKRPDLILDFLVFAVGTVFLISQVRQDDPARLQALTLSAERAGRAIAKMDDYGDDACVTRNLRTVCLSLRDLDDKA